MDRRGYTMKQVLSAFLLVVFLLCTTPIYAVTVILTGGSSTHIKKGNHAPGWDKKLKKKKKKVKKQKKKIQKKNQKKNEKKKLKKKQKKKQKKTLKQKHKQQRKHKTQK